MYHHPNPNPPAALTVLPRPCVCSLAAYVQEKEERKVRKEYRPADRRVAQQLKADEDFALRIQRQEREIEKHQLAHLREAQRRQMMQFDMGGVPQQTPQVCVHLDCNTMHVLCQSPSAQSSELTQIWLMMCNLHVH